MLLLKIKFNFLWFIKFRRVRIILNFMCTLKNLFKIFKLLVFTRNLGDRIMAGIWRHFVFFRGYPRHFPPLCIAAVVYPGHGHSSDWPRNTTAAIQKVILKSFISRLSCFTATWLPGTTIWSLYCGCRGCRTE